MKMTQFLKWKADPSKGEVFTPIELVNEMLDNISESIWRNPESIFLDPCMGKGTFLIEIVRRLVYIYGYTEHDAKSRVYGYDIRVKYINYLQRRGFVNVRHKDFLSETIKMKFDAIVGNPPFSKNSKEPKKLWSIFVEKSFSLTKDDGVISLITPSSWISITNYVNDLLKNKLQFVKLSSKVSESFKNVGGTQKFIYFVAKPNLNNESYLCEFDERTEMRNLCETSFAPVKSSSIHSYNIVKKLKDSDLQVHNWVRYDKIEDGGGVILPMSKGVSYIVQFQETDSYAVSRYKLSNLPQEQLEAIGQNLNLKIYKLLRWVIRSGPALASNFKSIPIPNFPVSDQELYNILNLSSEEINYVESNVR